MSDLLRCPAGSAGRFRVTFHMANNSELYRIQIGGHNPVFLYGPNGLGVLKANGESTILEAPPVVDNETPFEGVLCEHEVAFLHGIPGKDFRESYEFTVVEI